MQYINENNCYEIALQIIEIIENYNIAFDKLRTCRTESNNYYYYIHQLTRRVCVYYVFKRSNFVSSRMPRSPML